MKNHILCASTKITDHVTRDKLDISNKNVDVLQFYHLSVT